VRDTTSWHSAHEPVNIKPPANNAQPLIRSPHSNHLAAVVTNEQAKRKTPSVLFFTHDGERLFGDAAVAAAGKSPDRVILDGRDLIGQCAAEPLDGQVKCPRASIVVKDAGHFSGEETVAMLLGMARRQASASLEGAAIKDVVVSVPAWFDDRDRIAIADSARIIGLNCLAVVNANTAAALKYAIDGKGTVNNESDSKKSGTNGKVRKSSSTRTQTVMFFDLGSGSATASIAEIVTDIKTGIAASVKMLGHAWQRDVGGRALDQVLLKKMASDFDAQREGKGTPARELPRVMMRLRKEAQRTREILSANTETQVSVPSLHDDIDFRTLITREDFETGAADILRRAVLPASAVLAKTGLKASDLDAVVPFGGASRTPRFQALLCETLGIATLNKSINTDEAAVMGTAFVAASLSSTFRVRKVDIEDKYPRTVSAEVERDAKSGGLFTSADPKPEPQKVIIFKDGTAKMPSKKTLSFKREHDFSIRVYLDEDKTGISMTSSRMLYSKLRITGVSKVLKKLQDSSKAIGLVPQIAVSIIMDHSGFIRVSGAEASIDETIVVERDVEVRDDDINKANVEDDAKKDISGSPEPTGDKKDDEKKTTTPKKTRKEKSSQTVVHRQTLAVTYETGPESIIGSQMDKTEVEAAKKVLADLERADMERQERADALNALEGFVLEIRSSVRSAEDEHLYQVTTEEERDAYVAQLEEAEDWMYTDDAKVTANLRSKLSEVRKVWENIESKRSELLRRPAAVKALRDTYVKSTARVTQLRELHEERGNKHLAAFDEFTKVAEAARKWLNDVEAAQRILKSIDKPAFTARDVAQKILAVQREALAIADLKLPPKVPSPPASLSNGEKTENGRPTELNETTSGDNGNETIPAKEPFVELDSADVGSSTDSTSAHDEL
jgi:hypoxia up-regulated 1